MFKNLKKKCVYLVLFALVINLFSNVIYAVSDTEYVSTKNTTTVSDNKGDIEIDINLDLPIVGKDKSGVYLKITDEEGYTSTVSFDEFYSKKTVNINLGSQTISVKLQKLDFEGKIIDLDSDEKLSYYAATFYSVKTGKYSFEVTLDGATVSEVKNVELKDFSKRITFSNKDGSFFIGDLNNDGIIDNKDADELIKNINTKDSSIIKKYDLNKDKTVDIVDLTYIAQNIGNKKKAPKIENTSAIIDISKVDGKVNGIDFDVTKLLQDTKTVSELAPANSNNPISKENPVEIKMDLKEAVLTKEIRIVPNELSLNNSPSDLIVEVEDINGKTYSIPYNKIESSEVHTFTDESTPNTIVIDLGTQVAVRKITIKINGTKTNTNLVEIAKVELLNNVYDKPPAPQLNIPKNVKAKPDSEMVTVTWNTEPNVTGYQVKIEKRDENSIYETRVFQTSYTEFTIKELDNYTEYTVSVQSVNGEWKSLYSDGVKVTPIPTRKPPAPEMIVVNTGYLSLNISWKDMKDTKSYNLYYKEKGSLGFYTKISNITGTSYKLENLKDNTEYEIYLTGNNELGEGIKSTVYIGKTAVGLEPTITPNYKLINTANGANEVTNHIKNVTYPLATQGPNASTYDKFDIVDNDFSSYWQINDWTSGADYYNFRSPIAELDNNYLMDTFIITPYEDQASHYDKAVVAYYDENNKQQTAVASISSKNDKNGKIYYTIKLKQPVNTNKIQINLSNSNSYLRKITISEMKLYYYDSIENDINALYKDDLHIELRDEVTLTEIENLEIRVNTKDSVSSEYHPNRDMLLNEIDIAKKILADTYISDVITVDKTISNSRNGHLGFAMALNDYQPLGIVAKPGQEIVLYVGTNGSVMPEIVFTQYYAEVGWWTTTVKNLHKGQNVITVPKIGNMDTERGGSVYVRYPNNNTDSTVLKVRVSGGEKIPTLDITGKDEQTAKNSIRDYIIKLKSHIQNMPNEYANGKRDYAYDELTSILNSTELVTNNVILSIPATKALQGITSGKSELEAQVNGLYESLTAFEEIMGLMYKEKGLSADAKDVVDKLPSSRINIRSMRMFDGAFMYAGGFHVGIGPNSVAPLMQGKTKSVVDGVTRTFGYFGWGISHEIGHQIDEGSMIYDETSNNIYSLFVQTADDISLSRLEINGGYNKIYEKVTSGTKGLSQDVFTQLGMFWQLRLAYDNEKTLVGTDTFYSRLNKLYRRDLTTGADKNNLLMRLASDAAGKDLTEFFVKWGFEPTQVTLDYIKEKGYEKETRQIQYLNDDARRYKINGGTAMANNTKINASISPDASNKKINLTFGVDKDSYKILGYEILRNGVPIAFTQDSNYVDELASLNNMVFEYEVIAYDKLLNKTESYKFESVKINYDGKILSDKFSITSNVRNDSDLNTSENPSGPVPSQTLNRLIDGDILTTFYGNTKVKTTDKSDAQIIIELKGILPVAGIKYTAAVNDGVLDASTIKDYEIYVSTNNKDWTIAKKGKFDKLTAENNTQTIYFDKAETSGGNQLWTYQISYIKIVAKNSKVLSGAEISLLNPPGDNVEFNNIGILEEDFKYGLNDTDIIKAGSVVFTGDYRGNPSYNVVLLTDKNDVVVEGDQILLAELPENSPVDEVASGTWVFYIEPEQYGNYVEKIKANLYRTDNALTSEGQRFVSDTLYLNLPKFDELPKIKLTQDKK